MTHNYFESLIRFIYAYTRSAYQRYAYQNVQSNRIHNNRQEDPYTDLRRIIPFVSPRLFYEDPQQPRLRRTPL